MNAAYMYIYIVEIASSSSQPVMYTEDRAGSGINIMQSIQKKSLGSKNTLSKISYKSLKLILKATRGHFLLHSVFLAVYMAQW